MVNTVLHLDKAKIPSMCPVPMCKDKVPQSPTPYLRNLYERYHKYCEGIKQHKRVGPKVHLVSELCMAITNHWEDNRDVTMTASDSGWLLEIDYETLPDRIITLKKEITAVIANEIVLDDSAAWTTFINNLKDAKYKLYKFQGLSDWVKFHAVGSNAHAG